MNVPRTSLASFASALFAVSLAACGSDDPVDTDAGVNADAAATPDMGTVSLPDAGRPDAQSRPDATSRDADLDCVMNGTMSIDGTDIMVGSTTTRPINAAGENGIVSCRGNRPTLSIGAPIRVQGCIDIVGDQPTMAELAELQIAVFYAENPADSMPTDPTYDPVNGADMTPTARITPDVMLTIDRNICPRGVRMVLGRDSIGADSMRTDIEYIVRTRSATAARGAEPVWVDQYNFGVVVRSDSLESGGGAVDRCTPQMCSGRVDLLITRRHTLHLIGGLTGVAIEGFANLSDHVGSGHLMVQTLDCAGLPIANAVAGFTPAPPARTYLDHRLMHGGAATVTSSTSGILLGLGFTGTTTIAPRQVVAGSAISSDGTCTEPFGGRSVLVYPDALSLVRLGRETVIVP